MAMIKGKQLQSINAAKIVESAEKRFVSDVQIASFAGKAEVADVQAAKTEASEALAGAKVAITGEIATAKGEAITAANQHADTAVSGAKTAASDALAAARLQITAEVGTAKTEAVATAKAYTDGEATKQDTAVKAVDAKVVALEGKVTTVENNATTGLQDRYTKAEIDQKLSQVTAGILYKGTVASFGEIATKFPTPERGWLVAVEGTNKFYVYDGITKAWEEFPIELAPCTTHVKTLRLTVTDNQKEIATGIKTNGAGALQTSTQLVQEMVLTVNGIEQTKTTDFTIAVVENEVKITWKSADYELEASDVVAVTYNQTV